MVTIFNYKMVDTFNYNMVAIFNYKMVDIFTFLGQDNVILDTKIVLLSRLEVKKLTQIGLS